MGGKLCEGLREDLGMVLCKGNECIRLADEVRGQEYWMTESRGGIWRDRQCESR